MWLLKQNPRQPSGILSILNCLLRVNGNLLAVLAQALETNNALDLCKQSVVLAAAYVQTRMDLRFYERKTVS